MLAYCRLPKLIYHDSDGVDKVINLGSEPLLIGRATECHIQTQDAMVSRRHARIIWDGNYVIEDLGSSNGVYVGNDKVQRAPIRPGDTVTCGSLVLRLMPDTAPRLPPTSAAGGTPHAGSPIAGSGAPPPAMAAMADGPTELPSSNAMTVSPNQIFRAQVPISNPNAATAGNQHTDLLKELDREKQEVATLKRKIDQLNADLKRAKTGAAPPDDGEREARLTAETERDNMRIMVDELQRRLAGASTGQPDPEKDRLRRDVKQLTEEVRKLKGALGEPRAGGTDPAAADTVILLSDALAELRGSLRAASGEAVLLKQPEESVQVVQDSLKSAAEQLEGARASLRALAKLLGV
jgi:hypothetical protein